MAHEFTQEHKDRFVEQYRKTGNKSFSARALGFSPGTIDRHREIDEAFDDLCKEAELEAADALEAEARRRAVEGVAKGVWHKGAEVGFETVYSDTLLLALLKGRKREVFGDSSKIEMTGKDGAPVMGDTEIVARLTSLLAAAQSRMEG